MRPQQEPDPDKLCRCGHWYQLHAGLCGCLAIVPGGGVCLCPLFRRVKVADHGAVPEKEVPGHEA